MPLLPDCEDCGQPRDTRSPRCATCRRKHRTELQNASQRRRRAGRKPTTIRPADRQRIATTATLATQAADALADWLNQPPARSEQASQRPATERATPPPLTGPDYARALIDATHHLHHALHAAGLLPPAAR